MADSRRQYLQEKLINFVNGEKLDTVVEYLLTIDPNACREEFETFLKETCGQGKGIKRLVNEYSKFCLESLPKNEITFGVKPSSSKGTHIKSNPKSIPKQKTAKEFAKCGCMATRHKFVTSCMCCGRIHCDKEMEITILVEDKQCVFCGAQIVPPMSADDARLNLSLGENGVNAYKQKVTETILFSPP